MAKPPCRGRVTTGMPAVLDQASALAMMQQAQQALFNKLTGQMPAVVETPQLGRVQYAATTIADLQRLIDYLATIAGTRDNRKPFSIFGWP